MSQVPEVLMMNDNTPMVYLIAGVLVPGAVMFGARFVGQAPSMSGAQTVASTTSDIVQFPEVLLLETDSLDEEMIATQIESPFWFEEIVVDTFEELFQPLVDPRGTMQQSLPEFKVTTILPHPKNPLAIINSKPHRVGDEIQGGWELMGIDGKKRTVTLVHKSGKLMTLSLIKKP